MILDHLSRASIYRSLHPHWDQAFDYLRKFDLKTPTGRYNLAGDSLYALVQGYIPADPASKRFESHRRYADIQYMAAGDECIWHAPLNTLTAPTPFDEEKDYSFYGEPSQASAIVLTPGMFAYFLPADGHKPGCICNNPASVVKVVLKVRLDP
jgi:biofilm protein TabA